MYNDFSVLDKCILESGKEVFYSNVKVLREAFGATEEEISVGYTATRWREIREERTKLLAECDWIVTKYTEIGKPIPTVWATYRQALRDITEHNDPDEVVFPVKPK
jgi:Phage tail assembly chaperone protein